MFYAIIMRYVETVNIECCFACCTYFIHRLVHLSGIKAVMKVKISYMLH